MQEDSDAANRLISPSYYTRQASFIAAASSELQIAVTPLGISLADSFAAVSAVTCATDPAAAAKGDYALLASGGVAEAAVPTGPVGSGAQV